MATDNGKSNNDEHNLAANIIRAKIDSLYDKEPAAKDEVAEMKIVGPHRSKHQQYMYNLTNSGRSLAEIQTAWHKYYIDLPDKEKHEVWKEFYELHGETSHYAQATAKHKEPDEPKPKARKLNKTPGSAPATLADVKKQLLATVVGHGHLKAKHHLKSLLFGLSMGAVVVLILLFGFFNERFIAPFISPSRLVSSTPIIVDPNSAGAAGSNPQIIIPKINVEVPVVYDLPSIDEKDMQHALERGVVHYAASPNPGEVGNGVIVGHSSNNILNHGRYKFAFVLLSRLVIGDTFIIDKDNKRYVYKVYDRRIVSPTDLSVLGATDKKATMTLITCDPPGTSINRLVVVGEQILPDPNSNLASSATKPTEEPKILPSNAPSLWQRLKDWFTS